MLLRVEKSHWIWQQEASGTLARVVSVVAGGVDGGAAVGRGEEEAGRGQASPSDVFYVVFCEVEEGGGDVIRGKLLTCVVLCCF